MGVRRDQEHPDAAPGNDRGRRRWVATGMLVLLTVIWGLTFPATKAALEQTDPIQFLALRFVFGFVLLVPLLQIMKRARKRHPAALPHVESPAPTTIAVATELEGMHPFWFRLRTVPLRSIALRGAIVGLFLTVGFILQVLGMQHTTASRSGFFTGLLVVMVPPLAMLLRTSRSPLASWLAILPALFGIYLLADPELGGLNIGDLLTIGCALAFALQMVVLEALSSGSHESNRLTLWQIAVIMVVASAWALIEGKPVELNLVGWLGVGYTALFGSVVAVYLQTRYQPDVPAGHAALIFILEPVFAATFAWILLNEPWTARSLAGGALVLAAMGLSSFGLLRDKPN